MRRAAFVRPLFTLFDWTVCQKCGLEFRREPGWSARRAFTYTTAISANTYVCADCCPTDEDAARYVASLGPIRLRVAGGGE